VAVALEGGYREVPGMLNPTIEWEIDASAGFLAISNGLDESAAYIGILREDFDKLAALLQDSALTHVALGGSGEDASATAEKAGRFLVIVLNGRKFQPPSNCNRVIAVPLDEARRLAAQTQRSEILARSDF
jgi:hypothetical protein